LEVVLSRKTPKMKNKLSLSFLVLIAFLFACGGNDPVDEGTTPEFTPKELIFHGGDQRYWLLTKELISGTDVTSGYAACELDNIYIFDKYGNYNIDAGATKCANNPEQDVRIGFYEFDEANNKLKLGNSDTTYTVDILVLETSKLRWQVEVGGELIERTFTPK